MATKYLVVDDTTGKTSLATGSSGSGSSFVVENFDVAIAGTTFSLSSDIANDTNVEVWKNGQLVREGASYDYIRSASLNQIIFNSAVGVGSWVSVKVWS